MEEERQGNVKYKRYDIQRKIGKEVDKSICWSICN